MGNFHAADLSIGEVARRTAISPSTLRMWEVRYGFPDPDRSGGHHRRYTEDDCRLILEVRRARAAGLSMEAAIARSRERVRQAEDSMFGGLLLRHPETEVVVLPEPFMLGLSRAIEELMSGRPGGVLLGAFQREGAWVTARPRWDRIARDARAAAVFADFPTAERTEGLWRIPVRPGSALAAEWSVVCDAPGFAGCLVGRELPGRPSARGRRRFEAIWSLDPVVVRDAARIGASIASATSPDFGDAAAPRLRDEARPGRSSLVEATTFMNRVFAHLTRLATSQSNGATQVSAG